MKRYLGLTAALFAFFLLYYFPAPLAWQLLQKQGVDLVELQGVGGSWHSGSAASARLKGTVVSELSWRLRPLPWAPLRGRLAGTLGGEGRFAGGISAGWRGPAGLITLTDLEAELPLSQFSAYLARQGLALDGIFSLDLPRLELAGGVPRRAAGEMRLRGLKGLRPMVLALGDFSGEISTDDAGLRLVLRDEGGPLAMDGLLQLDAERNYTFTASLTPRDPQNQELVTVLGFLGRPDREGVTRVSADGRW